MTLMLSQLFQLFAFLLLGMFARWKIIVDGSFPGGLSRVVVDFFLPCMLFLSVYDNLSLQTLQEERSAFLWGAASFLVTFPLYTFLRGNLRRIRMRSEFFSIHSLFQTMVFSVMFL